MAKLTEDQIKWVLDIDAKGVHKEIAVTSSEIRNLEQDNKRMAKEMKEVETAIKEMEKEMARLTRAGMENSEEFERIKAIHHEATMEAESYRVKTIENTKAIEEEKKKLEELEEGMSVNEMSMRQLRQYASELQKQLEATSFAANPEEYKDLQKELTYVQNRMQFVGQQGKGLIAQFAGMNHPIGTAAKAVQGFGQALKALIANPVGIVIMAIAVAFTAFKKAINSSEEASNKFQVVLAPLKALFEGVLYIVQKVVVGLLDLTAAMLDWASKAAEKLPFIGKWFGELNEKSKEAIALEKEKQDLRVRERESLITNSKKERDIAELRNKAKQRDIYTNEQIIGFLDEAIQLEKEIAQEKIEQAKISLRLLETEASRNQNNAETAQKIAEQTALLNQLETEYFNSTRRMESERFSRIDEMRREDETKAKEAMERKIDQEEFTLQKELSLLKQQLVNKEITQAEYDRMAEQKTFESLNRKLEIQGLEVKKRAEIEQQILDYKLKALEQEKQFAKEREAITAELQKSVMDENERELQSIRDKHATRLKELKEHLEKEIITEQEFNEWRIRILEEQDKELALQEYIQNEEKAARILASQSKEMEQEKMLLMEKYASGLLDKKTYEEAILALEQQYALKSLEISNLSDEQKKTAREKLLDFMIKKQEIETKKQEDEQKKRVALFSKFGEETGTLVAGFMTDNKEMARGAIVNIIEMALDSLQAQILMSIVGASAKSFEQLGPIGGAVASAAVTGLITAAFAGVKAAVRSKISSMNSSGSPDASSSNNKTGSYVVTGRESGGYMDVNRAQDGKYFRALINPKKRGFVDRPTVIVGDGPTGKSKEWVASNDALENPTVAPIIKLLNEAQQTGNIRTIDLNHIMRVRMAGLAVGGFLGNDSYDNTTKQRYPDPAPYTPAGYMEREIMKDIRDFLEYLKNNDLKAYLVYSEFQRSVELFEKSKKIGSRT